MALSRIAKREAEPDTLTLGGLVGLYREKRFPRLAESTQRQRSQAFRVLFCYFSPESPADSLTAADAEWLRDQELAKGLAEATVRKRCGDLKEAYDLAIRAERLTKNPFRCDSVPTAAVAIRQDDTAHVETAVALKVLDRLPNAEWRLLFALARWGGIRVPSEVQNLRWSDVLWDLDRIRIESPKTKRHGKSERQLPLWPALREPLADAYELADHPAEFVLPSFRHRTGESLRKPLMKAIRLAGETPWPNLWKSLRSTRATELVRDLGLPNYRAVAYLGYIVGIVGIADRHYRKLTDEDYRRDSEAVEPAAPIAAPRGTARTCKDLQNAESPEPPTDGNPGPVRDLRRFALICTSVHMTPTGFEPVLPP